MAQINNITNASRLITSKWRKVIDMKQLKHKFQKSIAFTLATALSISLFQFLGVWAPSALAASFEKDFSIGPGGAHSISHYRTFAAPAGVGVTAKVTFQREGTADIPITIEIENPDDGVVATKNEIASLSQQDCDAKRFGLQ